MNMGLDSAMDALAINNQALLTAANANASTAVWAWIAFLTAAISFSFTWKIKNSSINYIHSSSSLPNHLSFKSSSSNDESLLKHLVDDDDVLPSSSIPPATLAASLTSTTSTSTTFCWLENRRSGKFSLHYYGQTDQEYCLGALRTYHQQEAEAEAEEKQEEEEEEERLDYDEEDESMKGGSSIMHKDDDGYYQIVLKMKTSEMGWYHHQDLSMLHGNVVRFWTQ